MYSRQGATSMQPKGEVRLPDSRGNENMECSSQLVYKVLIDFVQRLWECFMPSTNPPDRSKHVKIPDSLHMLYDFQSDTGADQTVLENPKVDIIFFHGLQAHHYKDAYWKTWTSKIPGSGDDPAKKVAICWPEKWLGPDLQDARIFSVTYDSRLFQWRHVDQNHVLAIGEKLVNDIIVEHKVGQNCPVILVGHSLGGLMIKKFIILAQRRKDELMSVNSSKELRDEEKDELRIIETFLSNLKGVFFYSTPHHGSDLTSWAKYAPFTTSPVLDLLLLLSTQTEELNEGFRQWRQDKNVSSFNVCEARPTIRLGMNVGTVVPEGSARCDNDGFYKAETADHFSVCKPPSKVESRYQFLRKFIIDLAPEADRRR